MQHKSGKEALRVQLQIGRRIALEGEELKAWQDKEKAQMIEAEPMENIEDLER